MYKRPVVVVIVHHFPMNMCVLCAGGGGGDGHPYTHTHTQHTQVHGKCALQYVATTSSGKYHYNTDLCYCGVQQCTCSCSHVLLLSMGGWMGGCVYCEWVGGWVCVCLACTV